MRDRRRLGAKNSRGPAFIFGKQAGAEPKNDIELRFLEAAEYGNIPTVRIVGFASYLCLFYAWITTSLVVDCLNES